MQDNKCGYKCCSIHSLAFGISAGIIYGLSLFILAIVAMYHTWPASLVNSLANFYIGYSASWQGAFYGLFLGFIDFFVFAYLWGLLYNLIVHCCACCYNKFCCKDKDCKTQNKK